MKRRQFIATGSIAMLGLSSANTTKGNNGNKTETRELQPFKSSKGEGKSFWGPGGDKYEFLVTGNQSGGTTFILHADVPSGGGPPPHIHNNESESYYVEEGDIEFLLGEKIVSAKAGDFIHIPKGTVHTFTNKGKTNAGMLTAFAPSGMEGWFEEVLVQVKDKNEKPVVYSKQQLEKMIEAGPRHGVTWKLPPEKK